MDLRQLLILFLYFGCLAIRHVNSIDQQIKLSSVKGWADKLGVELWSLGDFITRRKEVQDSFKTAQVKPKTGASIAEEIAAELKLMMAAKVSAVRRIVDLAENSHKDHEDNKKKTNISFQYANSKTFIEPGEPIPVFKKPPDDYVGVEKVDVPPKTVVLEENKSFPDGKVNLSMSSVVVAPNVFDRSESVIRAIEWSEKLDKTFVDNFKKDPSLSYQFFGSATGFMRQFPAQKWNFTSGFEFFDCRLRQWYIEAVNSPKDIIILVDNSGSMKGVRKEIAGHVVNNILDTLGPNDYVNIFTFSNVVNATVPCFNDSLVQATLGNIRAFRAGMQHYNTTGIANFTAAFSLAFEILEEYRSDGGNRSGANCNQAIMLVSDGAPFDYHEVFMQYNWRNNSYKPVRVFTYLVGREVTDMKNIKYMACENQGYYVHLSSNAEVREEVLNYIPVVARPLVLGKTYHPVIWSQVYADVVEPILTDWIWLDEERQEQKVRNTKHKQNNDTLNRTTIDFQERCTKIKYHTINKVKYESSNYNFVTTVAMPAYDNRSEAYKIANILGAAGTDIPIKEIKSYLNPYELGVNGYAFIVNNNGMILLHPDFRPIFQTFSHKLSNDSSEQLFEDILKPAYNSVDMTEVELMDDDSYPRDFSQLLLNMRDLIIKQTTGSVWLLTKSHYDDMKRVVRIKREYYWTAIDDTPFTLVISYPDPYGLSQIKIRSEDEIHRMNHGKGSNINSYFQKENWKIHPDWVYCKYRDSKIRDFKSPESELMHFLKKMKEPGWKWPLHRTPLPPEHSPFFSNTNSSGGRNSSNSIKDSIYSYYCDRKLMQALVFDARVTEWFSKPNSSTSNARDDKGPSPIAVLMGLLPRNELKQRFGITVVFMATHSGLTRWNKFSRLADKFGDENNKAIDEIWYRRAVEQHFIEGQSFVFSIPFNEIEMEGNEGNITDPIITATHAIFHTDSGSSAPVAVVGFQFKHSAFATLFANITSNGGDPYGCRNDTECFILDNNGFILLSPFNEDLGKFFGEVRGNIMERLVEEHVYKQVIIYDYQGVCFKEETVSDDNDSNVGRMMDTPIKFISKFMSRLWHIMTVFYMHFKVSVAQSPQTILSELNTFDEYSDNPDDSEFSKLYNPDAVWKYGFGKPSRPIACDKEVYLYTLNRDKTLPAYSAQPSNNNCTRPFVVTPIPHSNLILIQINLLCRRNDSRFMSGLWVTSEIIYDDSQNSNVCIKAKQPLSRRRPANCIKSSPNETQIVLCGRGNITLVSLKLMVLTLIILNKLQGIIIGCT